MSATPFPAAAFAARRARLMRRLPRGSAAIFAGGREATRNGDVEHPFRQRSAFLYLTGCEEPGAVAVLRPGHERPFALFVRPRDPEQAVWVGPRLGVEGARERLGADEAWPIGELEERLPETLAEARSVAFALASDDRLERLLSRIVARRREGAQRGQPAISRLIDPTPLVDALRLVKSREEIAALQRAIDITAAGFDAAMRAARPGLHEYEVQAVLEAEFRRLGSPRDGFPSIVAAGANACTLHYTANRARIERGDLLLIDAGAEYGYYSADVTRTFPADGRFRAAQRDVYEVVLAAQRDAIAAVAPGARFHEVHEAARRTITLGLRDLGVLAGRLPLLLRRQASAPYFMHGTSHWLGLDVHDAGPYRGEDGESAALRPGMTLTVEPGLYFAPGAPGVPRRLRGIGVRIEDDVLVTRGGCRVLSGAIPKDIDNLEAIVGGG